MRPSAFANGNQHRPRRLSPHSRTSMRPSAFANGNFAIESQSLNCFAYFNEAVGFRQRKSSSRSKRPGATPDFNEAVGFRQRKFRPTTTQILRVRNFNEAVGFRQRKFLFPSSGKIRDSITSMRPSAFANGNRRVQLGVLTVIVTSMRPSAFANGNDSQEYVLQPRC